MKIAFILVFLVCIAAISSLRARRASPAPRVTVDAEGIRREGGRVREAVRWAELERIVILTTDEGPLSDDVYWLFMGPDETGCAVPGPEVGDAIFAKLSELPGVDYDAIVRASGSAENASFEVWTRSAEVTAA